MTPPRPPIQPAYAIKSQEVIGDHVTQIAVDSEDAYAVFTNADPARVAELLRDIADHIDEDLNGEPTK